MAPPAQRRLPSPGRLARLWPRVRPYRGTLILAALALIVSSLIGLAFPKIVGYLLDAAFVKGGRQLLDKIALGLLGLFVIQAVLNFAQTYWLSATGERAIAGMRQELFGRLLEMPPGFFADRRTGELISRLTADVGLLQGVMSHQIAEFSRQVLTLVGGVIALFWMQPRLTLTALVVVPFVVLAVFFFGRRLRRISLTVQDKVAEATAQAEEAVSQIRTVQSFVQEPAERKRYGDRVGIIVKAALDRAMVRGVFFGVITFATFAGVVIVLWQGGRLVLSGDLTAGTLVGFLLYTIYIAAAIGTLVTFFSAYQEAVGAAERVFEILEAPSPITDPPNPERLPVPVSGRIRFQSVSFRYGGLESPLALAEVSLEVQPGEIVALVGPSGAGKTTLVSLLPRFWDVTEGSIQLDEIDIRRLRLSDLRRNIGVVPQEPALFSGTVRDNIAYADPGASKEKIEAAARAAHAHEFIERLPARYDTLVGERGVKLSGGQRQRIAIARAILKDPAVLVLDEATSSLDNESERLIEDAMEKLLVGRTTLIIAHRLSTVRRADRLVVLDRGRIVEEGSHAELVERGGLYARLYQMQFREDTLVPLSGESVG
ncbi:MAG TPA: ABC transporter transmembrane domain-containing protein [Gemmatimonadales bacterium]|jgi:subfamily B ATP-binding cassette protein MsbA|nr:ABC transporter transmembrane domain-containing protein [Gemmatimonadales bacterium]